MVVCYIAPVVRPVLRVVRRVAVARPRPMVAAAAAGATVRRAKRTVLVCRDAGLLAAGATLSGATPAGAPAPGPLASGAEMPVGPLPTGGGGGPPIPDLFPPTLLFSPGGFPPGGFPPGGFPPGGPPTGGPPPGGDPILLANLPPPGPAVAVSEPPLPWLFLAALLLVVALRWRGVRRTA